MRTCTIDGCDRKHVAKGLCKTHYNQANPNRHPKVLVPCDECGAECEKEKRQARYSNTFCSLLCRDHFRFGPTDCVLPKDHWARWYGRSEKWYPPMPETLECGWCGEEFTRKTVRSRFCTSRCGTKFKQTKRRGTQAGSPGTYSWADIVKLWLKFDKCCAYCRLSVPMTNIEAEHVIPLSKGGANNTTNLLPSCKRCNSDKRDLLLHEWALDRERRHLDPVHTAWAPDDERYKHLVMSTHALAA